MGQPQVAVDRLGEVALSRIGGEVDDGIGAGEHGGESAVVGADVGDDDVATQRFVRADPIDPAHVVPERCESWREVATDATRSTGDRHAHRMTVSASCVSS